MVDAPALSDTRLFTSQQQWVQQHQQTRWDPIGEGAAEGAPEIDVQVPDQQAPEVTSPEPAAPFLVPESDADDLTLGNEEAAEGSPQSSCQPSGGSPAGRA